MFEMEPLTEIKVNKRERGREGEGRREMEGEGGRREEGQRESEYEGSIWKLDIVVSHTVRETLIITATVFNC